MRPTSIKINGTRYKIQKPQMAYDEICQYADIDPENEPFVDWETKYYGGNLLPGQRIDLEKGLEITVGFD